MLRRQVKESEVLKSVDEVTKQIASVAPEIETLKKESFHIMHNVEAACSDLTAFNGAVTAANDTLTLDKELLKNLANHYICEETQEAIQKCNKLRLCIREAAAVAAQVQQLSRQATVPDEITRVQRSALNTAMTVPALKTGAVSYDVGMVCCFTSPNHHHMCMQWI
jgi:hypothetical protein